MRHFFLPTLSTVVLLLLFIASTSLCRENPDIITLTLPAAMIKQSLQSILPLPLDPGEGQLQGRLVLDSISTLEMRENGALVKGMVLGSDLSLNTRIGDQNLNMNIGELRLPLTCDFTFRFDAAKRVLYVTPHLEPPAPTQNPQADAVLPFLTLLSNKEYPVSLASLQTFTAKVGDQDITVAMEPVDIRIAAQQMVVKMKPKLRKNR